MSETLSVLETILPDCVYESLENDDHTETVIKIYSLLKFYDFIKRTVKEKLSSISNVYRQQGNDAYKSQCYRKALRFYNMALSFAPSNSRAMKLAYSNRSALWYSLHQYKSALKDIDMCFQLNCPDDIIQKLKARKHVCEKYLWKDVLLENGIREISTNILKLGTERNNQISCITKAIGFDTNGSYPKVIAVEDIKIGTVVALETAFVAMEENDEDHYLVCHHCLKPSLNLIPCQNCCTALFCDENCKQQCFEEYHNIECKLIDNETIGDCSLALKAVIKMKNKCVNWDDFIEASNSIINNKVKTDDPQKILNDSNNFLILCNTSDKYLSYGQKFKDALTLAAIIKDLEKIKSFFPETQDKKLIAVRALVKQLMHILMFVPKIDMPQYANNLSKDEIKLYGISNALFSFIGKLQHSCDPNLILMPMNNKAALVAICPVARGTALSMSYIGHYLTVKSKPRQYKIYDKLKTVCSCRVCIENWGICLFENYTLSKVQKKYLKDNDMSDLEPIVNLEGEATSFYKKICKGLELFNNLPNTDPYDKYLFALYQCLCHLAFTETFNIYFEDN